MVGQPKQRRRGSGPRKNDSQDTQQAWAEFVKHHAVGTAVRGIVRSTESSGVLAQISPHVTGFVPRHEITQFDVQDVRDILWPGDIIEAVVTGIDGNRKLILVSMQQLHAQRVGQVGSAVPETERARFTVSESNTRHIASAPETTDWPMGNLFEVAYSQLPLFAKLEQMLRSLCRETNSTKAFLVRRELAHHSISLVAGTSAMTDAEALSFSPIQDIWAGQTLLASRPSASPGLMRLLTLLQTDTIIGVPVRVGERADHALLVCGYPGEGNSAPLLPAVLCASLAGHNLTEAYMKDALLDCTLWVRFGKLTSMFMHEVANHIDHLGFSFSNLTRTLTTGKQSSVFRTEANAEDIRQQIERASSVLSQTREWARLWRCLGALRQEELIDGLDLLNDVVEMLSPKANKDRVDLGVTASDKLPQMLQVPEIFRQALLNVVLYSLEDASGWRRQLSERHTGGRVVLAPYYDPHSRLLKIRVVNNGPGIHRCLWDEMFSFGLPWNLSSASIGTLVARQMIESLGGQLLIEDSIMLGGTTFLLNIPAKGAT